MHGSELIFLYYNDEDYLYYVYFDTRDKKYYKTCKGYKQLTFTNQYWILLTFFLLLTRVSELVFSTYYSLFGSFIGFLFDIVFSILSVFIGKAIARVVKFDKQIAFSLRDTSHEIQITQDDLKERVNDIWICYKKNQNLVVACICVSVIMSLLVALISNGMLFAFACIAWMTTWVEIWHLGIGERKKWLMEYLGDDFFT